MRTDRQTGDWNDLVLHLGRNGLRKGLTLHLGRTGFINTYHSLGRAVILTSQNPALFSVKTVRSLGPHFPHPDLNRKPYF